MARRILQNSVNQRIVYRHGHLRYDLLASPELKPHPTHCGDSDLVKLKRQVWRDAERA